MSLLLLGWAHIKAESLSSLTNLYFVQPGEQPGVDAARTGGDFPEDDGGQEDPNLRFPGYPKIRIT